MLKRFLFVIKGSIFFYLENKLELYNFISSLENNFFILLKLLKRYKNKKKCYFLDIFSLWKMKKNNEI